MRWLRKHRVLMVVAAIGIVTGGLWWALSLKPVVAFAGFTVRTARLENPVATFTIENRSLWQPYYSATYSLRVLTEAGWKEETVTAGCGCFARIGRMDEATAGVLLVRADGTEINAPFQVGFSVSYPPPAIVAASPAWVTRWLPDALARGTMTQCWSEVVRPSAEIFAKPPPRRLRQDNRMFSNDEIPRTITLEDGRTFARATVGGLRPEGAVISTEAGETVVPIAELPAKLRREYAGDGEAIGEEGIDGIYRSDHPIWKAGAAIHLTKGRFFLEHFDYPYRPDLPSAGRYERKGHWVIFDDARRRPMVLALVEGKLALLFAEHFKLWKDDGVAWYKFVREGTP
jgi:hypothetical protein